jgi:polyisoprenoid-binding protein YceI
MICKYLFTFLILFSSAIQAQHYVPTDEGSKVHFVIKNFGINTGGDFTGLKGDIYFTSNDQASCKFNVSVSANTVDTDNPSSDKNLKSDEYFDVQKYPDIKIVSTKINKTNKTASGFYYFTGDLMMHGITKTISFPFHAEKLQDGYLFTGDFEINRLHYAVGEDNAVLGNKVIITLKVFAKKK